MKEQKDKKNEIKQKEDNWSKRPDKKQAQSIEEKILKKLKGKETSDKDKSNNDLRKEIKEIGKKYDYYSKKSQKEMDLDD